MAGTLERVVSLHPDGSRSYDILTYAQIAAGCKAGIHMFSSDKWNGDPDWRAKAALLTDEDIRGADALPARP